MKKRRRKKFPKYRFNELLVVIWDDILSDSRWLPEISAKKVSCPSCLACGFFLSFDNDELKISPCLGKDGERDVTVIPIGCIQKITRANKTCIRIK